ncbi:LysR family transcriptional regulator [Oscillibacter sp.]|uniref:LysR family transcriptional regulator n=1 Tax=Oscillibacter sp. TaxID=1945593 RepID=UPI00289ACEEE|nr:LysR family transcriptional regulator [Oscillibacter sp.]
MDTEKCGAILCTIREGSLSAAAEHLRYAPSGMSRMVDSLEKEAGFSLLKRSRNGVAPTADYLRLFPLLQELDRTAQRYAQMTAEIRSLEIDSSQWAPPIPSVTTGLRTWWQLLGGAIPALKSRFLRDQHPSRRSSGRSPGRLLHHQPPGRKFSVASPSQ